MGGLGFRRRKYLISPRFQLGLSAKVSLSLVVYGTVILYLGLKPITDMIGTLPFGCLIPEVQNRLLTVPREAVLLGLVMVLFVSLLVIRLSHRVAGPVFRLNREIRQMAAGMYPRSITLRKYDHLKELAEALTILSRRLEECRQALLGELGVVQGVVTECASRVGNGAHSAVIQADLEHILQHIQTLKEIAAEKRGEEGERQPAANGAAEEATAESTPAACGRM
jgi:HAMP domain-containing protein